MAEYTDWRVWAKEERGQLLETARKYSGTFIKALVEAYVHADDANTELILDTWSTKFEELFTMWKGR